MLQFTKVSTTTNGVVVMYQQLALAQPLLLYFHESSVTNHYSNYNTPVQIGASTTWKFQLLKGIDSKPPTNI
jgi:hypothetical protein